MNYKTLIFLLTYTILSLETCVKFNLIKRLENHVRIVNDVKGSVNCKLKNFASDNIAVFTGMGTFPGEHKIKIK